MKKQINFLELPHDIQIDIIQTLYSFHDCHIEHAHGQMKVICSYTLCRNYPEDHWISQEFTKESLHMYVPMDWNTEWHNMTRGWEYMTDEEKNVLIAAEKIMLKARAEMDLKHIRYMSEVFGK